MCSPHHQLRLDAKRMGNRNQIGMEVSCPLVDAYLKIPALLVHQDEQGLLAQDEVAVEKLKIHTDYFPDELEVDQYLILALLVF
jgi:hypothetical protein